MDPEMSNRLKALLLHREGYLDTEDSEIEGTDDEIDNGDDPGESSREDLSI